MKSFNEYLEEELIFTPESIITKIKNICGKNFKFVQSSRYGNIIKFLIKSLDSNVTISYDNMDKAHFNISIFSQNLNEKELDKFMKLVSETQEIVEKLSKLDKSGHLENIENSH